MDRLDNLQPELCRQVRNLQEFYKLSTDGSLKHIRQTLLSAEKDLDLAEEHSLSKIKLK
jgi:hypothetical protein